MTMIMLHSIHHHRSRRFGLAVVATMLFMLTQVRSPEGYPQSARLLECGYRFFRRRCR